jgi:hypothetical protein
VFIRAFSFHAPIRLFNQSRRAWERKHPCLLLLAQ